jgi:uncharacterized protein YcbX
MKIESLYRYPVKGLTPEPLAEAVLTPGRCLPWDRSFALAQGDSSFDAQKPGWVQKSNFMCLLRNAKIARLATRFDDATRLLNLTTPEGETLQASPFTTEGQACLTKFFIDYLGEEARYGEGQKPPAFHHFENHSFCDHKTQVVSLIGFGSLGALEAEAGAARDKRRFRANIYIENIDPWAEFGWLGKTLAIGSTTLLVEERIDRCGATSVNPDTALRDANPVKELQTGFGHIELGVFAKVLTGGEIRVGDEIRVI